MMMNFEILIEVILLSIGMAADTPYDEAKLRLTHAQTRAIGNFRSAESIEANLSAKGMALHPHIATTRARIESALNEAQIAVEDKDLKKFDKLIRRAEALLDRFAKAIGGE